MLAATHMVLRTAAAASFLALTLAGTAQAGRPPALARAIRLYESFEDVESARAFRAILASSPTRAVAAQAHLYLGLIAVNHLDAERAIREFKQGLVNDPTLDVGPDVSPKARLTFDEARHELERQLSLPTRGTDAVVAAPAPTTPTVTPTVTPAAPPPGPSSRTISAATVEPASEPSEQAASPPTSRWHSPALALVLGGVGLVAGALAIYGGVQVANYNSFVSSANGAPGSVSYPQTLGPMSAAQGWAPWVIPLAVLGVLGVAGGCFTW
jgi:cell division septation protein DedD